jgi:hypothetical protein
MKGSHASLDARGSGRLVPADFVVLPADVVVETKPRRVVERGDDTDLGHAEIVKASSDVLQSHLA